jgi:regulator of protease activity HflC (stomatin/prohibitin superfamily)
MSARKISSAKAYLEFPGFSLNGWPMLFVTVGLWVAAFYCARLAMEPAGTSARLLSADSLAGIALFLVALGSLIGRGLTIIRPNDAMILLFFGAYHGTVRTIGFRWCNPLAKRTKISLKARNLVSDQLKVNDKRGNPIEIAAVVVWRIADTAQAVFEVENYDNYVRIQIESAVRHLASHLAYAPEITQTMLRRQQAEAVISARKKIVQGAVSMVEMALNDLQARGVVDFDPERRAAMVSNLLVVLCGESEARPVINTGTLYH